MTGTIERIFEEKGFGFIKTVGEKDVFFHLSGLAAVNGQDQGDLFAKLEVGQHCTFETEDGPKGARATNIRVA